MRRYRSSNQQKAPIHFVFPPPQSSGFHAIDFGFYRSLEAEHLYSRTEPR
eukprot:m.26433 g.26433  ORF g.26433 m.26433 type:complete len:50 (-) comp13766_c0_seq3:617-766(-)